MIENFLQFKDQHALETFGEITMNEYTQMVADLAKPGTEIITTLNPATAHMLHMAAGLMGEIAELKEHQLSKVSDSTIIEELGDIEFYFEGLCLDIPVDMFTFNREALPTIGIDILIVSAGKLLDYIKKVAIYDKSISTEKYVTQLVLVRNCIDRLHTQYGLTQEEVREHNMNKLLKGENARYKEGSYSDTAAIERSDKKNQH